MSGQRQLFRVQRSRGSQQRFRPGVRSSPNSLEVVDEEKALETEILERKTPSLPDLLLSPGCTASAPLRNAETA